MVRDRWLRSVFRSNGISESLIRAFFQLRQLHLGRPGVTGVDIGYAYTEGTLRISDPFVIRVHVRQKRARSSLTSFESVSPLPGVGVDVVQADYRPDSIDPERIAPAPPLRPGTSISHRDGRAGTLGLFVRDRMSQGRPWCLLSCDHVIYGARSAKQQDEIVQPAIEDADGMPVVVALAGRRSRGLDAAIARLVPELNPDLVPIGSGAAITAAAPPRVGMAVVKSGRTTGMTVGVVTGIGSLGGVEATVHVGPTEATPDEVITEGGDSGAIWYDPATFAGIGLHCLADRRNRSLVTAAMLPLVLARLRVDIETHTPY